MFKLTIPSIETYDAEKNEFVQTKEYVLQLEHSLVSLSKWEGKWCKPFLTREDKSFEESVDYVRCMTMTQNVDQAAYLCITPKEIDLVSSYIDKPMTATVLPKDKSTPSREIVTAELIYYWMITMNIPFECQKWHLNRLLTLINVCSIKNATPKKRSKREIMDRNAAINAARRQKYNTKG